MNQTAHKPRASLTDFDCFSAGLKALGLPLITPQAHTELMQVASIETLTNAFNRAAREPNARKHVEKVIEPFLPQSQTNQPGPHPANVAAMSDHRQAQAPDRSGSPQNSNAHPAHREEPTNRPQGGSPQDEAGQGGQNVAHERERRQYHVYGGKGALTWEITETRRNHPTLQLEAAASNAPRSYDWSNKISVQFTKDELLSVAAVFLGIIPGCDFSNHGPNNDKGFRIENQQGRVFVQVRAPSRSIAVPVGPADAFYVASLVATQIRRARPGLASISDVAGMLKMVYARLQTQGQGGAQQ
ncbi:MAG: hypothetical protein RJQ08_16145 [Salinisphaeraceae bacterium]